MRYGRRRKLSPEEVAFNIAQREKRATKAMHCQCCGRAILANTGTIAHHGYERPGDGWQTSSCIGAKYLPYEADRTQLGKLIDMLRAQKKDLMAHRDSLKAEKSDCSFHYRVWNREARYGRGEYENRTEKVTRATFEAARENLARYGLRGTFDDLLASNVASVERKITNLSEYVAECSQRYNAWRKTHRWNGKAWEPIDSIHK